HRHRSGRTRTPERTGHDPAAQADRLCFRPGRRRLRARHSADHPEESLGGGSLAHTVPAGTPAWARPRRPTGHRLYGAAGAHPGWARREATDWRGLVYREGIPRAGRRQPLPRWHGAPAVRPDTRRREAEARTGFMAERTATALRTSSGPQTPDPPHVRARRSFRHRAEARPQWQCTVGRTTGGQVAVLAARREVLR